MHEFYSKVASKLITAWGASAILNPDKVKPGVIHSESSVNALILGVDQLVPLHKERN